MKQLTTILLIAFWPFHLNADMIKTAEAGVVYNLGMELEVQIDSLGKELPKSWDDFETIGMMKNGLLKHQLFQAKTINSFALVPTAPIIEAQPGISQEYQGHRLFLISKKENFTTNKGSGRYAILIKPQELDSQPMRIFADFIPEGTAKLILNKIPDFDPARQPLAFEDLSPFEREKQQFQENIRPSKDSLSLEDANQPLERNQQRELGLPDSDSSNEAKDTKENHPHFGWIVAGSFLILILAIMSWLKSHDPK